MRKYCVAIVCDMETCSECLSVYLKWHTAIELITKAVSRIEIHPWMQIVYGHEYDDMNTMFSWAQKYKDGEPGRPDYMIKNEVDN